MLRVLARDRHLAGRRLNQSRCLWGSTLNASQNIEPSRRSAGAITRRRERLPWPADREFRILAIDGGGIKGIFPASFLAGLEERYLGGKPITRYFDLIAGTSTGGIIALGLGAGLSAARLRDLYIDRGGEVFPPMRAGRLGRAWRSTEGLVRYRYNRDALSRLLQESFGSARLRQSCARLCVPAMEGHHGEVIVYKTPHHPDYHLDGEKPMVSVAEATSAAPTFFQPLQDETGYVLVDGGVWANNPTMIALTDALSCFDVSRDKIRILGLGCGTARQKVGRWKIRLGGKLLWWDLILAAMDLQSQNSNGQAGLLIGADRLLRVEPPTKATPIELDDWHRAAAELPLAAEAALDAWGDKAANQFLDRPAPLYNPANPAGGTAR